MNDIVRKHGSERGFTLMECIISLVILGFVAAVITGTMAYGVKIYHALRTGSAVTGQAHVAAAVVKRLAAETAIDDLDSLQKQFSLKDGTLYWNGSVLLEQVADWTIKSASAGSGSRSIVQLSVTLQDASGSKGASTLVYEFHPKWEPAQ